MSAPMYAPTELSPLFVKYYGWNCYVMFHSTVVISHYLFTLLMYCKGNTLQATTNICTHLWTFAHSRTRFRKRCTCANKAHFAQTRCTLRQPSPNLLIPTHGLIRTPITTHGLMRTLSLIDGKPPWMGTRPWMWSRARPEGAPIILECHTPSLYILRPCNKLLRVFSLDFPCKVFAFLVNIVYSI